MDTNLIQTDPNVMVGKPVVAGTRITFELILERLAAGETVERLLDSHPRLTRDSVSAALAYAAQTVRDRQDKNSSAGLGAGLSRA
jgi:uncharacterized protein (DUF433 family)